MAKLDTEPLEVVVQAGFHWKEAPSGAHDGAAGVDSSVQGGGRLRVPPPSAPLSARALERDHVTDVVRACPVRDWSQARAPKVDGEIRGGEQVVGSPSV